MAKTWHINITYQRYSGLRQCYKSLKQRKGETSSLNPASPQTHPMTMEIGVVENIQGVQQMWHVSSRHNQEFRHHGTRS
jgi:hypothetical protein